jgi:hypothetical protein
MTKPMAPAPSHTLETLFGLNGDIIGTRIHNEHNQLIQQDTILNGQTRYSRFYTNGQLTGVTRYHDNNSYTNTTLEEKDRLTYSAQSLTFQNKQLIDTKHFENVIMANGFPFAVDCCKNHKTLIKISTMKLI